MALLRLVMVRVRVRANSNHNPRVRVNPTMTLGGVRFKLTLTPPRVMVWSEFRVRVRVNPVNPKLPQTARTKEKTERRALKESLLTNQRRESQTYPTKRKNIPNRMDAGSRDVTMCRSASGGESSLRRYDLSLYNIT